MFMRAVLIIASITALGLVVRDLGRQTARGRGTPHAPVVRAAPSGPEGCPSTGPAGTLAWAYWAEGSITSPPAIDDEGGAYFGRGLGWLHAVGCNGQMRWKVFLADENPDLGVQQGLHEPLALGDDGLLHFASTGSSNDLAVFALGTDGRWPQPPLWNFGDQFFMSPRVGPVVLGEGNRVYVRESKPRNAFSAFAENRWSGLIAVDRAGYIPRGFPLVARASEADSVMVGQDHLVFFSDGLSTPTPRFPVAFQQPPTPSHTPTPTAIFSQTPEPTATATPFRSPQQTVTPSPTWTPRPAVARAMLPLALRQWHPVQPTYLIDDDAMLHILEGGRIPSRRLPLGKMRATALVATERMAVLEIVEQPPRLLAVSLVDPGGLALWEHRLSAAIVDVPLLGARDPVTGWRELVYADTRGLLVSMQVPEDLTPSGFPIFNWARDLWAPISGAPALGDDGLVYVGAGSAIYAIRRADGSDAWRSEIQPGYGTATGALTLSPSGILFVGTNKGNLLAIHTDAGGLDPSAAWPALRHDHRNTGRGD